MIIENKKRGSKETMIILIILASIIMNLTNGQIMNISVPIVLSNGTIVPISIVPVIPNLNNGTVALYGQCGGIGYKGPKNCGNNTRCQYYGPFYSNCIPISTVTGLSNANNITIALYGQCGGIGYIGPKKCGNNAKCQDYGPFYSNCIPTL